jgi:hypothetical protein
VFPIIEPVKINPTTTNSFDQFAGAGMPFVLVTNPTVGELAGQEEIIRDQIVRSVLWIYDNYLPARIVGRRTTVSELEEFEKNYEGKLLAVIYRDEPTSIDTRNRLLTIDQYYNHIFIGNRIPRDFRNEFLPVRQVLLDDRFHRCERNADYPMREFFSDMNTDAGNIEGLSWGDFSIVGDNFAEKGGAAHAVALHHVHYTQPGRALEISHFISDRTETTADVSGKVVEALQKLVRALDYMEPPDTEACNEYRELADEGVSRGLGYMKKLAIKQHLEVLLQAS